MVVACAYTVPKVTLFEFFADVLAGQRQLHDSQALFRHDVSQFHLRGFSGSSAHKKAKIWRLCKATGAVSHVYVNRVCGSRQRRALRQSDLYGNAVDAWLEIVETHASTALRRLVSMRTQAREADRLTLAFYLALQSVRTPHVFDLSPDQPSLLRAYQERRDMTTTDSTVSHQAYEHTLLGCGGLAQALADMSWTYLSSKHSFVLSDHVLTYQPHESSLPSTLFVPLSTHTALCLGARAHTSPSCPVLRVHTLDAAAVNAVNDLSYECAHTHAFAGTRLALQALTD